MGADLDQANRAVRFHLSRDLRLHRATLLQAPELQPQLKQQRLSAAQIASPEYFPKRSMSSPGESAATKEQHHVDVETPTETFRASTTLKLDPKTPEGSKRSDPNMRVQQRLRPIPRPSRASSTQPIPVLCLRKAVCHSVHAVLGFSPRFPQLTQQMLRLGSRGNTSLDHFFVAPDLVHHRPVCITHDGDVVPVWFPLCPRRSGAF